MNDVKIRRGTREDADFLAWAMQTASRSHVQRGPWDLIIGADDAGCLEYLRRLVVAEPRSMAHFESFFLADVDGRAAATLCAFRPGQETWITVAKAMVNVQQDLGWTKEDVIASAKRVEPIGGCYPPDAGADWCIDFVATRPEFRRRGLVDALLREAMREGVERGAKLAQILQYVGNDAAQRAYEKVGFTVHDECCSPEFEAALGAPGFRRLMRRL